MKTLIVLINIVLSVLVTITCAGVIAVWTGWWLALLVHSYRELLSVLERIA